MTQVSMPVQAVRESSKAGKVFSRAAFASLFLILTMFAASAAVELTGLSAMDAGWKSLLTTCANYCVAVPVWLLLFRRELRSRETISPANRIGAKRLALTAFCSYGVYSVTAYLTTVVLAVLTALAGGDVEGALSNNYTGSSSFLPLLIAVAVVAPVVEEFLFRGVLYRALAPFGARRYILASALLFALTHGNLYQFFEAFLLGIVFACLTWHAGGRIRYSILLHFLVNLIGSGSGLTLIESLLGIDANVWYYLSLAVSAAAFITAIVMYVRRRKEFPGITDRAAVSKKEAYGSFGFVFCVALLSVYTLLMTLLVAMG